MIRIIVAGTGTLMCYVHSNYLVTFTICSQEHKACLSFVNDKGDTFYTNYLPIAHSSCTFACNAARRDTRRLSTNHLANQHISFGVALDDKYPVDYYWCGTLVRRKQDFCVIGRRGMSECDPMGAGKKRQKNKKMSAHETKRGRLQKQRL